MRYVRGDGGASVRGGRRARVGVAVELTQFWM